MYHPTPSRHRAFTLVELLVVISIISILVAMLLPVLSSAREAAHSVQCLSNMRQLGTVINLYLHDNNGWFPRSSHYWTTVDENVLPYLGWDPGQTANDYPDPTILTCPTLHRHRPSRQIDSLIMQRTYTHNDIASSLTGTDPATADQPRLAKRIERVGTPSEMFYATELLGSHSSGDPGFYNRRGMLRIHHTPHELGFPHGNVRRLGEGSGGQNNFVFLDGRAEGLQQQDIPMVQHRDPFWSGEHDW